jgi:NAD(P)-dependent dehydrogenase (short-subunit alcohol dehydrogenase family)
MSTTPRQGRVVLTTGANSGIGLATAIELARRGFRSVGSVRTEAKAEEVHRAAAAADVAVQTVLLDVNDADRCQEVISSLDPYGLVNNAGYALMGAIEDVGDDEARELLETMVVAPMRLARLALPFMRAQGGGRIVNISSVAGRTSSPVLGWYHGAKHALEALSDALRMEAAGAGIKVVLVEPGGFRTGIWDELESGIARLEGNGSLHADAYHRSVRIARLAQAVMGSPEQCGKVVAGAVAARSPRARYLVGLDAQAMTLSSRLTPTAVQDRVLRLTFGF